MSLPTLGSLLRAAGTVPTVPKYGYYILVVTALKCGMHVGGRVTSDEHLATLLSPDLFQTRLGIKASF